MVIIFKKTLEKKGADDVTSKSTDLGPVREVLFSRLTGFFMFIYNFNSSCQGGTQQGSAVNNLLSILQLFYDSTLYFLVYQLKLDLKLDFFLLLTQIC